MNPFKTKQFRELEEKWNNILTESGFEDAERTVKGQRVLKQQAANSYRQIQKINREARLEYYQLLSQHLHQEDFPNETDKTVITLLSDGFKLIEIASILDIHRQTVRFIKRRYEHKWMIRTWNSKQMNLVIK